MATFQANVGSDTGFAPPNELFDYGKAALTGQRIQDNQLLMQGRQLDLANANQAQVQQAAAGLLSGFTDEASRAAAYPKVVGMLQSQGFAMQAPPTYPGEAALRAIVNMGVAPKDLYSSGALMTPAQQALLGGGNTGTTTSTTGTGTTGTTAPTSGGPAPFVGANLPAGVSANEDQLVRTVYGEAGGEPVAGQQAVAHVIKTRMKLGNQSVGDVVFAPNQFEAWSDPKNRPRMEALDPSSPQYQSILNGVVRPVLSGAAQDPTGGATNFYNPQLQAQLGRSTPSFAQGNQTTIGNHTFFYGGYAPRGATTATAAPATAQPGQPVPTQVAGPPMVSTAPAASTAAPGGPPVAPQFTYPNGKVGGAPDAQGGVHYADGNYGTPPPGPRVPVAAAAPASTPAQPDQPQPAPAPAAQPAPAAALAGTSRLPEVSTIPTGQNSAPYKQAQAMIQEAMRYDAVAGTNPAFAKRAADLKANAAGILQAGATVSAQQNGREGELEVVTGKFTPYQALPSPRFTGGAAVYNKTTGGWDQPTPATQADAVQGHWGVSGSGAPQFFPEASVPPHANYDIALEDLKKDRGEIASIGDAGRAAQNDNLRVQEMRDILTNANTGPGTETAARLRAWVARWTPGELSKWDGSGANLSNPAAIEMFQKLGFVGAVTQERGSTPRGGYQATKLFQQFNPGAQLLTSTNQGLLAQRLIANQAEEDYAQGAQDHYNTQRQRLKSPERDYEPISSFDAKWQAQRNPQVYAAAIGALGGQDPEMWSRGLNKDEIQRVKDVVTRADPSAVIHMPGEGKVVLQPNGKPVPSGFKVQ